MILGCTKEGTEVSAADKAAADKAAAQKAAADKAAADKAASQKANADKAAADKAATDKAAADKAAADKAAADKAAADKAAAQAKAEASSLPTDLVQMKSEISRTMAQMDLTMAKLEALSVATGSLGKPSKDALGAIDTLETELNLLKTRGEEMRNRGADYFQVWEKQLAAMSTSDVAAMAAKRKDELSAKYTDVLTAMQETRAALDAYWADMTAIHKAVDDGLNPEKQKALASNVKAAKDKAATLKTRVEDTAAKLNQVSLIYMKP
jgi:hypothetical protein